MTNANPRTMKTTQRIAIAVYTALFAGIGVSLSVGAWAASGPPSTGKLPSMGDMAPGIDRAGNELPALYILATAILVGIAFGLAAFSLGVWLLLRLARMHATATEAIVAQHRAAVADLTEQHRQAAENGRVECHRHGELMMAKAEAAAAGATEASRSCAVALGQCNDTMERLDGTLRELQRGQA